MKKELYHYPIFILTSLICLSIIGIILGTFLDLNISKSLVNTSSHVGAFVESFGLSIPFITLSLGGTLLFKGLYPSTNKTLKVLGVGLFILSLLVSIYFAGHYLKNRSMYGITFNTIIAYLIGGAIILAFTSLFMYFISSEDKKSLVIVGLVIIGTMLVQCLLIEGIKNLASRPRYRYLFNETLNTNGDVFRYWYEFKPFTAINDNFKSFPSGHTATSGVMLTLPLITPFIKKECKYTKLVLTIIGLIYPLFIAFYRIRYGAHFLSDVSFGLLIVTLVYTLALFIAEKVNKKLEQKRIGG